MINLSTVIDWIEVHEHTVDLLKWLALGLIAWWSGLLRAVQDWTKRPTVQVEQAYSSYHVEQHDHLDQYTAQVIVAVLVDVRIVNPTKDKVGVVGFDLAVRRVEVWPRWWKAVSAVSLPSPPATPMHGNNVKVIPTWFTGFGLEGNGRTGADAQDSTAGMCWFVIAMDQNHGTHLEHRLPVKLQVHLATGRTCTFSGVIERKQDFAEMEQFVENSAAYARHKSVWRKVD